MAQAKRKTVKKATPGLEVPLLITALAALALARRRR